MVRGRKNGRDNRTSSCGGDYVSFSSRRRKGLSPWEFSWVSFFFKKYVKKWFRSYSIRFDDCCDTTTRIKYMTEGILIREMMADPLLRQYSVLVLDEVHERTLFTDVIMGLLKKILKKNKKLKLIVSSATVDAEEISKFFNLNKTKDATKDTTAILGVTGRMYPVDVFYTQGFIQTPFS